MIEGLAVASGESLGNSADIGETTMTLGDESRRFRQAVEITQREMGEGLGVSASAISAWERSRGLPRARNLAIVCMLLGVRVEKMLNISQPHGVTRLRGKRRRSE